MATTASVPVAGGTSTAFASAATDPGLIAVSTRDRQRESGVSGNRHTFIFGCCYFWSLHSTRGESFFRPAGD
jgi:hypothetical protein